MFRIVTCRSATIRAKRGLNRDFLDFPEDLFDVADGFGALEELHEVRPLEGGHDLLERLQVRLPLGRRGEDQEDQGDRLAVHRIEVDGGRAASKGADHVLDSVQLGVRNPDAAADPRRADLLALDDGVDDVRHHEALPVERLPGGLDQFLDGPLLFRCLEIGDDRLFRDELGELHGALTGARDSKGSVGPRQEPYHQTSADPSRVLAAAFLGVRWSPFRVNFSLNLISWRSIFSRTRSRAARAVRSLARLTMRWSWRPEAIISAE